MPESANGKVAAGERVRIRRDRWRIQSVTHYPDCQGIATIGCGGSNSGVARTFLLPFDRVLTGARAPCLRVAHRRGWAHHVAQSLLGSHPFGALRFATGATFELLPYQLEPALAMLRHARLRVLLADEVGLGKTIQAGILLNELARDGAGFRALILCPAGLREQWQRELESKFSLDVTIADTAWLFEQGRDLPPDVNPWGLPGIYIASLDLVKRGEVLRAIEAVTWDFSIVDEVHAAGLATARLAAAHAIGLRARRVLLLTATPPDGDPAHFDAITRIGRTAGAAPITIFRRTRDSIGMGVRRKSILLPVRLSPDEQAMHRLLERYTALVWHEAGLRRDAPARLAAVTLRKRALSSATSLWLSVRRRLAILGTSTAPSERQLVLPLADEEPLADEAPDRILGASGLADVALERACLEEIAAAAERAAKRESKLLWLVRLLRRIDEPAVVFTEYRDTLAQIAAFLAGTHRPLLLHGDLSPRERSATQRAFNRSGSLLLATDAASEGLNLHERCRLVIHFELPWTPMRLEQRTGRVDRLGQSRPVHEVLMVARDTAERLVLAPLIRRVRAASARAGFSAASFDESRVAAAILNGTAPESRPAVCPGSTTDLHLRAEADAEAGRLRQHRRLASASTITQSNMVDTAVTVRRVLPASGVLVVASLEIRDTSGRVLHAEVTSMTMNGHPFRLARSARDVAVRTERFLQMHASKIVDVARRHAAASLDTATRQARELSAALAEREREIAAGVRSTARALVQAGLFDRRALDRAGASDVIATSLIEDTEARLAVLAGSAPLQIEHRIIAIRGSR